MDRVEQLEKALRGVTDELRALVKDEDCDHSVGICWCSTFNAIECADALLENRLTWWEQLDKTLQEHGGGDD